MSYHQNAGQNHNMRLGNGSFGNLTKLKYLGMTVTTQNFVHEELRAN
jgi:hypothetical protein